MNIVSIMGSPNGMEGNTGQLLTSVLDGARAAGAEVETFCLGELDVRPCDACEACHIGGKCALDDDFNMIKEAMLESGGVVIASPNYIRSVSAQMKAFFDRCCGLLHIQAMEGKYGAAVVTSGGEESLEVEEYIKHFIRMLGGWSTGSVGAAGHKLHDSDSWEMIRQRAAAVGRALVKAIGEEKTYPEQETEKQKIRELMRSVVRSRAEEWEYEFRYWQDRARG